MTKILKIVRTEEFVQIKHQVGGKLATEDRDITFHECPLKSFDDALQALASICGNWLGAGTGYGDDVTVRSVSFSFTKAGTRSATIGFRKPLSITDAPLLMSTPCVQIDEPSGNEDSPREAAKKQAEAIYKLVEEAERYIAGDRQQLILPLATTAEDELEDGDALQFTPAKAANG